VLGQSGGDQRNDVIILSSSSSSPSSIVKFDVTANELNSLSLVLSVKKKKKKKTSVEKSWKGVGLQQESVERRQSVVWNYAFEAMK
jgi:hypothetical protein